MFMVFGTRFFVNIILLLLVVVILLVKFFVGKQKEFRAHSEGESFSDEDFFSGVETLYGKGGISEKTYEEISGFFSGARRELAKTKIVKIEESVYDCYISSRLYEILKKTELAEYNEILKNIPGLKENVRKRCLEIKRILERLEFKADNGLIIRIKESDRKGGLSRAGYEVINIKEQRF